MKILVADRISLLGVKFLAEQSDYITTHKAFEEIAAVDGHGLPDNTAI